MKRIKFRYKDAYSNWEWRKQECTATSVEQCKKFYGLDQPDVVYEIIEVKELTNANHNDVVNYLNQLK